VSQAPEWVELTKANGEIDAQLIAGGLASEGLETYLQKDPGVWRYGASDPFALVSIYVRPDRLGQAQKLLEESNAQSYEFEEAGPVEFSEFPDPLIRSRPLRWWLAAFVAGGLILALIRSAVPDVLF
jgi:hypothetical protein